MTVLSWLRTITFAGFLLVSLGSAGSLLVGCGGSPNDDGNGGSDRDTPSEREAELQADLDAANDQISTLNGEIESLQQQLDDAQGNGEMSAEELENLRTERDELISERDTLAGQLDELRDRLNAMQNTDGPVMAEPAPQYYRVEAAEAPALPIGYSEVAVGSVRLGTPGGWTTEVEQRVGAFTVTMTSADGAITATAEVWSYPVEGWESPEEIVRGLEGWLAEMRDATTNATRVVTEPSIAGAAGIVGADGTPAIAAAYREDAGSEVTIYRRTVIAVEHETVGIRTIRLDLQYDAAEESAALAAWGNILGSVFVGSVADAS